MLFSQRRFSTLTAITLAMSAALAAHAKAPRPSRTAADYAYIFNSGTRGLPGYRVYVDSRGRVSSATLLRNGRKTGGRRGTLTPAVTRRFFSDLANAGPVNALAILPSAATADPNAAPGVRVTLLYHGRQSSDLRQAGSGAGETLYQDVKQIIQVLRLPVPDTP